MADTISIPLPDLAHAATAPLWEAAGRGQFALPRCTDCRAFDWYPKGECRQCRGSNIVWTELSGRGTLFSWAVVKRALHKPLAPIAPYVSAIVVIDEDRLTRFVTRLIDCDPNELRAGMPVEVRFADLGYPALKTGVTAPLFAPGTTRDEETL
jgi:uncharacterized OB-fold protein